MKKITRPIFFFYFLFLSHVLADLSTIEDLYTRSLQLMNVSDPNSILRSSAKPVPIVFRLLQKYGCWCYFDEEHGKGHGTPQDGYDDACLALHHGVTCAMMEIENCNPRVEISTAKMYIGQNGDVEYR